MIRHSIAAALLALTATTPAQSQNPRDLLTRAAEALGGESALRAINSTAYDYYQMTFQLGQSELSESPARANIAYGKGWNDYRGNRRVLQQEARVVTGAVQRSRLVSLANGGLNEVNGVQNPVAPGTAAAQLRILRIMPERLVLTALDNPGTVSALPARNLRGAPSDGIRIAGQDTVNVYFDRVTGLPLVVETMADDPILGDRSTQLWYTRYMPAGGVKLPRQFDVTWNGALQSQVYFTAMAVNGALPDSVFAVPDSIARRTPAAAPPAPPALTVTMVELGPSVWRAEGTTHHTLVVEQPDQIVLVEAPQSTQRVRAVLDTVRARFPGKRIGLAVMTHYHWDHSGGIREIVAENIPIVTMDANAGFVRQVAQARRTLQPDNQAQRRRNPNLRTFSDSMVIGSGPTMVVLYRQPSTHAEGLLSAWVPSVGVLFTSDVVNPGAQGQVPPLGSAELVALARARGLSPQKYVGGHGVVVDWPNIERAAAQQQ